jgi:Flp pilus assembly protein TadB
MSWGYYRGQTPLHTKKQRMWSNARTSICDESILEWTIKGFSKIHEIGRVRFMLWTILVVLLLLWLFGFYGGFVTTSLIHLLLVAAVVVLVLNLLRQRRNTA